MYTRTNVMLSLNSEEGMELVRFFNRIYHKQSEQSILSALRDYKKLRESGKYNPIKADLKTFKEKLIGKDLSVVNLRGGYKHIYPIEDLWETIDSCEEEGYYCDINNGQVDLERGEWSVLLERGYYLDDRGNLYVIGAMDIAEELIEVGANTDRIQSLGRGELAAKTSRSKGVDMSLKQIKKELIGKTIRLINADPNEVSECDIAIRKMVTEENEDEGGYLYKLGFLSLTKEQLIELIERGYFAIYDEAASSISMVKIME